MAVVIWNDFSWLDLAYGHVHCFTFAKGSKIRSSRFIMQYKMNVILHRGQCSFYQCLYSRPCAAVGWAIIVAYIRLIAGLWCATFARLFKSILFLLSWQQRTSNSWIINTQPFCQRCQSISLFPKAYQFIMSVVTKGFIHKQVREVKGKSAIMITEGLRTCHDTR